MTGTMSISCSCGRVEASVNDVTPQKGGHVICYCTDCQAFAHYLGRAHDILDAHGGSILYQTLPSRVSFSKGVDQIKCVRVTPKGIFRWYTECCKTPLGNTASTVDMPFVGLFTMSFNGSETEIAQQLGPIVASNKIESAIGVPNNPAPKAGLKFILTFIGRTLGARISGNSGSPFFTEEKQPISDPITLSSEDRAQIDAKISANA